MEKLLFVDTNIYLDFYRLRTETSLSLFNHLQSISDKIIVTSQVEMEFKKNRPLVIQETLSDYKEFPTIQRPGFLSNDPSVKGLMNDIRKGNEKIKKIKKRIERILRKPTTHDDVYKIIQRIFTKQDSLNLTRDHDSRRRIRSRAFRRFLNGYPPRKEKDTSIGDAFNWEWIIEVANQERANIHIVSRDGDYGNDFINDWLLQEFKDRTTRKRTIVLHKKLSAVLREFKVKVTKEEIAEEQKVSNIQKILRENLSELNAELNAAREAFKNEMLKITKGPSFSDLIQHISPRTAG